MSWAEAAFRVKNNTEYPIWIEESCDWRTVQKVFTWGFIGGATTALALYIPIDQFVDASERAYDSVA